MRVLHLVPGSPFGGAQRLVVDLAVKQREQSIDASILLLSTGPRLREFAEEKGVPAQTVREGPSRFPDTYRLVRKADADILHLHIPPPWLAFALPRKPTLVHLHVRPVLSVHGSSVRRQLDALGERLTLSRADYAIAISHWVKDAWRTAYPQTKARFKVVYNGVNLPPVPTREAVEQPFTISAACRLSDRKGIEEFIEFATVVKGQLPDAEFRIAGDGPLREVYEQAARDAGLGDAIVFEGFVSDMPSFWAKANAAAFTSPFEPFGLRLIEPITHLRPVLAYKNGTGSDEVIAQCRGIISAPYGDPETLATEAVRLASDRKRSKQIASEGLEDVTERFSVDAMSASLQAVYDRMVLE